MLKLYVMVRTDADSMTPGRVAAQVCHAGTLAGLWCPDLIKEECPDTYYPTTIVLDGFDFGKLTDELIYFSEGHIEDPTYAVRDGVVTHYVEFLTTYFWLINDQNEQGQKLIKQLRDFPLYSGTPYQKW